MDRWNNASDRLDPLKTYWCCSGTAACWEEVLRFAICKAEVERRPSAIDFHKGEFLIPFTVAMQGGGKPQRVEMGVVRKVLHQSTR